MKKIFSLFTSLIMVISLVAVMPMMTAGAKTSGDYEYEIIDDGGRVEITGYNGNGTNLTIPSTLGGAKVTSIRDYAFYGCESLTSVTIPNSVTSIGGAFYGCSSLTSVTIPDSVTSIGNGAFSDCYCLTSVTIPDSVTSIGDWTFNNCTELTSITIPNSVTRIGEGAFNGCYSLTTVTIPDSVTRIGEVAFGVCTSLTSITIPNSVTSIGAWAFGWCNSLTSITVDPNNENYSSQDGVLFNKNKTELIQYPIGNTRTSYTIPNSVTSIIDSAFERCESLTSVTIPDSVTIIGYGAFSNCTSLTSITIPKNVTNIDNLAFGYYRDDATFEYAKINNFKIKCYSGTAGEKYAIDNGFAYELLDGKPAVVSGFKVTATSAQAVKLTWNKVSGATGYVVYRAISGKWVRVGVVKTNSFYEGKLKSGTSYRYAVKAYKTVNGKNYYSPSYPTLWTSTNPATVNFTLTAGSKKAVVKWSKVTGATGYKVYYKTSAKGKWIGLKTTTGTSYTKTGLTKGKTYYFTVKAYRTVNGKTYNGAFVTKSVKVK